MKIPDKNIAKKINGITDDSKRWISYDAVMLGIDNEAWLNLDEYAMSKKSDDYPLQFMKGELGHAVFIRKNDSHEWTCTEEDDPDFFEKAKKVKICATSYEQYLELERKEKINRKLAYKSKLKKNASEEDRDRERIEILLLNKKYAEAHDLFLVLAACEKELQALGWTEKVLNG